MDLDTLTTENTWLRQQLAMTLRQLRVARNCLSGISGCCNCEICRGAAQLCLNTLHESTAVRDRIANAVTVTREEAPDPRVTELGPIASNE